MCRIAKNIYLAAMVEKILVCTVLCSLLLTCASQGGVDQAGSQGESLESAQRRPFGEIARHAASGGNLALFKLDFSRVNKLFVDGLSDDQPGSLPEDGPVDIGESINSTPTRLHGFDVPEAENEPAISRALIGQLTACPPPHLNLTRPTISSNIEWQVFVYCTLGLLPRDEVGNVQHFPQLLPSMTHKFSSLSFVKFATIKYVLKNLHRDRGLFDLTNEEKLALFERIFLVTKFRMLTLSEKTAVEELIERRGLVYTSFVYLINWGGSAFYKRHFDFSKDPQPAHQSLEVFGLILDLLGQEINGSAYSVATDLIPGFKTSGVSQSQEGELTAHRKWSNFRSFFRRLTGHRHGPKKKNAFSFNFHLQFYAPLDTSKPGKSAVLRRLFDRRKKQTTDAELPVIAEADSFQAGFETIIMDKTVITDAVIVLQPDTGERPPEKEPNWPDTDLLNNSHTATLDYSLVTGDSIGACARPTLTALDDGGDLVEGIEWQDLVACLLGIKISDFALGNDYWPLAAKRSAFDFIFLAKEQFLTLDDVINLSEAQIAGRLYETITFRTADASTLGILQNSIDEFNLSETLNAVLENWFLSIHYNEFDYGRNFVIPQSVHVFSGSVVNDAQSPNSGVSIEVATIDGSIVGSTSTSANGTYNLRVSLPNIRIAPAVTLRMSKSGFAQKTFEVPLASSTTHLQNAEISALGTVTTTGGGQAVSSDDVVTVTIPPGAASSDVNIDVSATQLQSHPNFPDAQQALFTITPDLEFDADVEIRIDISPSMEAILPDEDRFLLLGQNGDNWELLESVYNPDTNRLTALTSHFSAFLVTYTSQVVCFIFPETEVTICVPANTEFGKDPAASVFERRTIQYPSDINALRGPTRNSLVTQGWELPVLQDLEQGVDVTAFGLPQTCFDQACPFHDDIAALLEPGFSMRDFRLVGGVQGRSFMEVQAEQCGVNTTASLPQVRVLQLKSVELGFGLSNNADFSGTFDCPTGIRFEWRCVKKAFGRCILKLPLPALAWGTCSASYSYSATNQLSEHSESFVRNFGVDPVDWRAGAILSAGNVAVSVFSTISADISWIARASGKLFEAKLRFDDEVRRLNTNRIQSELLGNIRDEITQQLNAANMQDPEMTEENCFPPEGELPDDIFPFTSTHHTCAIVDGGAKCWGRNTDGQLGDGTLVDKAAPVPVEGLDSGVTDIATGANHTCAVVDGKAMCWGLFLGVGSPGAPNDGFGHVRAPAFVQGLPGTVTDVTAGQFHSCAVANGGAYCWGTSGGISSRGILGNPTSNGTSAAPVTGLDTNVTAINAGQSHTCAISNGAATCWGNNLSGELGNTSVPSGTESQPIAFSNIPVQVEGLLSDVTRVSAGGSHSCAIKSGSAKCWGQGIFGQLGNPSTSFLAVVPTPVQVEGLTVGVTDISAGGSLHTCAVVSGEAKCWGSNPFGQLGIGTTGGRANTPVMVPFDIENGEVLNITAGFSHTCALTPGPVIFCWGRNFFGQLGTGGFGDTNAPNFFVDLVVRP